MERGEESVRGAWDELMLRVLLYGGRRERERLCRLNWSESRERESVRVRLENNAKMMTKVTDISREEVQITFVPSI